MPFKPGQSGNPTGRPRDAGAARRLRELMTAAAPSAALTLATLAKNGDLKAAIAVLGFVLPPLRQSDLNQPLKLAGKSLTAKAASAIALVEKGELSAEQARALVSALGEAAKLRELDQLEARITQLEEATRKMHRV